MNTVVTKFHPFKFKHVSCDGEEHIFSIIWKAQAYDIIILLNRMRFPVVCFLYLLLFSQKILVHIKGPSKKKPDVIIFLISGRNKWIMLSWQLNHVRCLKVAGGHNIKTCGVAYHSKTFLFRSFFKYNYWLTRS